MAKKKKKHTKRGARPAPDTKRHVNDWHTMFYGALELILDSKLFSYQFQRSLTKGPLQIDAIIVKKLQDVEPTAKIAKLFLRDNIIEFKGPGDNMSVGDFYKVHAYAYLYRSITETASIREITLTFVERPYPEDTIKHLEDEVTVHGVFTYIVPIIYLYAIYSVSEQIEITWYTIYGIH
jgi:hypothetical protein